MTPFFGNDPEMIGSTVTMMSVMGAVLASLGAAFVARAILQMPLHKGLILSALTLLVYHGVFALGMRALLA